MSKDLNNISLGLTFAARTARYALPSATQKILTHFLIQHTKVFIDQIVKINNKNILDDNISKQIINELAPLINTFVEKFTEKSDADYKKYSDNLVKVFLPKAEDYLKVKKYLDKEDFKDVLPGIYELIEGPAKNSAEVQELTKALVDILIPSCDVLIAEKRSQEKDSQLQLNKKLELRDLHDVKFNSDNAYIFGPEGTLYYYESPSVLTEIVLDNNNLQQLKATLKPEKTLRSLSYEEIKFIRSVIGQHDEILTDVFKDKIEAFLNSYKFNQQFKNVDTITIEKQSTALLLKVMEDFTETCIYDCVCMLAVFSNNVFAEFLEEEIAKGKKDITELEDIPCGGFLISLSNKAITIFCNMIIKKSLELNKDLNKEVMVPTKEFSRSLIDQSLHELSKINQLKHDDEKLSVDDINIMKSSSELITQAGILQKNLELALLEKSPKIMMLSEYKKAGIFQEKYLNKFQTIKKQPISKKNSFLSFFCCSTNNKSEIEAPIKTVPVSIL